MTLSLYNLVIQTILNIHQNYYSLKILEDVLPDKIYDDILRAHFRNCATALVVYYVKDEQKVCRGCVMNYPEAYEGYRVVRIRVSFQLGSESGNFPCFNCSSSCVEQSEVTGCVCCEPPDATVM